MKEFVSPLARWPGSIWTATYLTFPQLLEWEKATRKMQEAGAASLDILYVEFLPLICKLVTKWELEGLPETITADVFPGSPELLNWLTECVTSLFGETGSVSPNSPGPSTPV